jgi:hypothetical protein
MIARAIAALVLTCVLTGSAASAASSKQRSAAPPAQQEPMTFYVVKGAPDSCGRDCDSWIEAEGKIESDTGARFKTFLKRLGDRNLPIYFASPGGNLEQAMAMGNMLHAKPTVAGVGRTMVRECGLEAQDSDVCVKLKNSGRELHGDLLTSAAICASACPYVFAGAAVHEVALDAVLAIHSPKVLLSFRGGRPEAFVIAAADQRGHERADRLATAYLARMGIDAGLLALTKTIKFEDIHVLTRDEIARFGLDRRESVETHWRFENNGLNMLHKIAAVRRAGETSFRLLQWRVTCFDANRFALDFQRPAPVNVGITSVSIAHVDLFVVPVGKAAGVEQWSLRGVTRSRLEALVDHPQIEFIESSIGADGRLVPQTIKLSNEGWTAALVNLLASCPPAKGSPALRAFPNAAFK